MDKICPTKTHCLTVQTKTKLVKDFCCARNILKCVIVTEGSFLFQPDCLKKLLEVKCLIADQIICLDLMKPSF